jgi:CheY-like chemotaxis protein
MNTPLQPFIILLAEDEPADAYLVKTAIAENHILADLHQVNDGREAIDFLRRQGPQFANAVRPDLILLDLNMPRMDGLECLTAIKADADLRSIPVIILTTSETQRDIVASYDMGAAGYITKPVDVHKFIDAIRQLGEYWFALVRLPHHDKKNHE